jgi:hypothetical protein
MAEETIAFLRERQPSTSRIESGSGSVSATPAQVRFDRAELNRILALYGRMVSAGEWRDYAIDFLGDRAVFSIYRRSSEVPLYIIEKNPKLRARQGQYAVIAAAGLVLKRGHELVQVLRVLERKLIKALSAQE